MINSWVSNPQAVLTTQQAWAIAIGINQYQHFQPLSYAQHDAQVLRNFLVSEAGFASDHALLLTDISPAVAQGATFPSRANLQSGITQVCQQLQDKDSLWCFFSGYGVRFEGQDYLMPIEGDPTQAATTGIAIAKLFSLLQAAATDNILLILDMNRSQSTVAGESVGEQTIALARESGIPTILSCQPGQFSQETLALRQGLFTAALIEGLRYQGCRTIEHLVQFLSDRLPELSEHHWRPPQHPLAIVPAEKRYQLILQDKALPVDNRAAFDNRVSENAGLMPVAALNQTTFPNQTAFPNQTTFPNQISKAVVPVPPVNLLPTVETETANRSFWRQLLIGGGAVVLLLLLGVLLRYWTEFTNPVPSPLPPTSSSPSTSQPPPAPNPATSVGQPSPSTLPTGSSSMPTDSYTAPVASIPSPSTPLTSVSPSVKPTRPVSQGLASAPAISPGSPSALDRVRADLDRSIATIPSTQVSAFSAAIEQAHQIPASDPLHAQAQQDIDRWSRVILSVAEQRAGQSNGGSRWRAVRNYRSAIDAAELVPRDRPVLHARSQRLIALWNQKIRDLGY
jgi:uncharacterized caspase-like protein